MTTFKRFLSSERFRWLTTAFWTVVFSFISTALLIILARLAWGDLQENSYVFLISLLGGGIGMFMGIAVTRSQERRREAERRYDEMTAVHDEEVARIRRSLGLDK